MTVVTDPSSPVFRNAKLPTISLAIGVPPVSTVLLCLRQYTRCAALCKSLAQRNGGASEETPPSASRLTDPRVPNHREHRTLREILQRTPVVQHHVRIRRTHRPLTSVRPVQRGRPIDPHAQEPMPPRPSKLVREPDIGDRHEPAVIPRGLNFAVRKSHPRIRVNRVADTLRPQTLKEPPNLRAPPLRTVPPVDVHEFRQPPERHPTDVHVPRNDRVDRQRHVPHGVGERHAGMVEPRRQRLRDRIFTRTRTAHQSDVPHRETSRTAKLFSPAATTAASPRSLYRATPVRSVVEGGEVSIRRTRTSPPAPGRGRSSTS